MNEPLSIFKKQITASFKHVGKVPFLCLFLILFAAKANANSIYSWTGGGGDSNWNNPFNWSKTSQGFSSPSTYPGQTPGATDAMGVRQPDQVNIGYIIAYSTAGSKTQPTITATVPFGIDYLIFGGNFDGASTDPMTLTINTGCTLTVNLDTKIINQTNTLFTTPLLPPTFAVNNTSPVINLAGGGTLISTKNFYVGDGLSFPSGVGVNNKITVNCGLQNLIVSPLNLILPNNGDLVLRSARNGANNFSNSEFNLISGGNLTILQMATVCGNGIVNGDGGTQFFPGQLCTFNMGITGGAPNSLTLIGDPAFSLDLSARISFTGGFPIIPTLSTVVYNKSNTNGIPPQQQIYTPADYPAFIINQSPTMYPNLTFNAPDGIRFAVGNALTTVGGNLTTNGGCAVNLFLNSPSISVMGNWTNTGNVTLGAGAVNIGGNVDNNGGGASVITGNTVGATGTLTVAGNFTNGNGVVNGNNENFIFNGNYTNNLVFTTSPATNITFSGTNAQLLTDNTDDPFGTTFYKVQFQNGGIGKAKTMSSGAGKPGFFLASTGVMTLSAGAQVAANGVLTLNSDVNSTATVAAIPAASNITGNVNAQRFIKGSADLNKRGYRALSSPVYTGTDGTNGAHVFDPRYLLKSIIVTGPGGTTKGFSTTTTINHSSIYLFREDCPPPPTSTTPFTTGYNWKGISDFTGGLGNQIGTQSRLTTTIAGDTTTTIPVGNGLLVYFRGDTTNVTGKTVPPYVHPEDVVTTQIGQLNTGTINVRLWYANAGNSLGNNFSYTPANTSLAFLQAGYTFVGNPYASTINWEKFDRNGPGSSISSNGSALLKTIYMYNESTLHYDAYTQQPGGVASFADSTSTIFTGIGSATNMIAPGQGFFVKTNAPGKSLTFRETAKTNTQPTAAKLNNLMGAPKQFVTQKMPLLRLRLVKDAINNDEIVIRLSKNASTKYVINEDAEDLGGDSAPENMSAFSSDGIALAIDFMPFPGKQQEVVPLFVGAPASGTFQLVSTEVVNLPPLYQMCLKDAYTNDSLLMKTGATYPLTIDKSNAATFGNNRFSIVIRQNAAYAYKLLDFTASKTISSTPQVQLTWRTQYEENYTHFTVERSTDGGKTFAVAGGMASTGAGTYSLLDKKAAVGKNLYRLKQEDINGTITYSKIITVQYSSSVNIASVKVYPNPTSNMVTVTISKDDAAAKPPYLIEITNSSGFLVKQVTTSQANWETNVSGLMPGTYIIKVHNSTNHTTIGDVKFVKL